MKQSMKYVYAAIIGFGLTIAASSPAQAQVANADFSVGYQATHVPDLWFPIGFYVDASGNVTPMFRLVGEFSGAYKSEDTGIGDSVTFKIHTFMGGARVMSQMNPQVTAFGQVLVGGANVNNGFGDSLTKFALQIGGGANVAVTGNLTIRVGADYRPVFFSEDEGGVEHEFRFVVGIVLPIGR